MSTITELLAATFRTQNLIAVGTSPTTAQTTEALARLNAFVTWLYDSMLMGTVQEWSVPPPQRTAPVSADYPFRYASDDLTTAQAPYPPVNSRLVATNTVATTIYFPHLPNDGAQMFYVDLGITATLTVDGNGRKIEAALTKALLTSGTSPKRWFYRADLGDWKLVATLVGGDDSPFPASVDDFLILGLYMRLAPSYGHVPSAQTQENYSAAKASFMQRYRQPTVTVGAADMPEASQTFGTADESDWMT